MYQSSEFCCLFFWLSTNQLIDWSLHSVSSYRYIRKTILRTKIKKDPWTEQCAWSIVISLCRRHCFPISSSSSFLFSPPPDVSGFSSGTTLKLNQLHTHTHVRTHTHPNKCLSVSSLGLMPASLFQSLSLCIVVHIALIVILWPCWPWHLI